MGITCSARTLAIIGLSGCFNHAWYSHLFCSCFTEYNKRGSVAGSPKVQGRDYSVPNGPGGPVSGQSWPGPRVTGQADERPIFTGFTLVETMGDWANHGS